MLIFVRLNGTLAQSIGSSRIQLTLPDESTVKDLLDHLKVTYPNAATQVQHAIPVIGGNHQAKNTPLSSRQEVALLMPVAGG